MEYIILIFILFFFSFLILGLVGMCMKNGLVGIIGIVLLVGVMLFFYFIVFNYFVGGCMVEGVYFIFIFYNFEWLFFIMNLYIDMGIMFDFILVMMLVVIFIVSLMVYIYLFGYMKGEKGF